MSAPILFALLLSQQATQTTTPATQVPVTPPPATAPVAPAVAPVSVVDFAVAPTVVDPIRLRLTPTLDGKIQDEEWDPLANSAEAKTYLQWQPRQIHAAAVGAAGKDLLVTLDLNGDGWLVGKDNLEVRVSATTGAPVITARLLDATNVTGPIWRPLPGIVLASHASAVKDGDKVTYELSIVDPGLGLLPASEKSLNARVDLVGPEEATGTGFGARACTPLSLGVKRGAAIPTGLKWNIERADRPVVPGEKTFLRFTFNGDGKVAPKRIELRSEGVAKDATNVLATPFPGFDSKGRAFVDYSTVVAPDAGYGYRIARATLTGADGVPAIIQASYRFATPIDLDVVDELLPGGTVDRGVKIHYYLRSNSRLRQSGTLKIVAPTGFKILNGDTFNLRMPDQGARMKLSFDLFIPANSVGSFPIKFTLNVNGKPREETVYVNIGGDGKN